MQDGSIVIASITSCTNTSNPYVMIGAGLVARKAAGPWVEPQALGQDVARAGLSGGVALSRSGRPAGRPGRHRLQPRGLWLHHLHRQLRSAGCGNLQAINDNDLIATAVLSGNRNFEGRISPDVRANYLASPPLVVAYALVGDDECRYRDRCLWVRTRTAMTSFLKDIWPSAKEIADWSRRQSRAMRSRINTPMSSSRRRQMAGGRDIRRGDL